MKRVSADLRIITLSLGLTLAGAFLVWRGFTTPPGEPALEVPRREDWSATEAKVVGGILVLIGIYGVHMSRARRQPSAERS